MRRIHLHIRWLRHGSRISQLYVLFENRRVNDKIQFVKSVLSELYFDIPTISIGESSTKRIWTREKPQNLSKMSAIPRKVFIQVDTSDEQVNLFSTHSTLRLLG